MRKKVLGGAFVAVTAVVAALSLPMAASAAPTEKTIPNSAPGWLTHGKKTGTPSASAAVQARVYLSPNGGLAALAAAATAVSTPKSSTYHRYLSPADFHAKYDATSATVSAVKAWLTGAGLAVAAVEPHGRYLDVTGSVGAANAAFQTTIANYSHDGLSVQAPSGDLHAPDSVAGAVLSVSGLDTTPEIAAPHTQKPSPPGDGFRNATPCSQWYGDAVEGSTPTPDGTQLPLFNGVAIPFSPCGYTGPQLRGAYEGASASSSNGGGVTVGIVDAYASPTIESDAARYGGDTGDTLAAGQLTQSLPLSFTRVNTGQRQCDASGWYGEETLDVEAVHAMAPAAGIRYYASKSCYDKDFLDTFARINDERKVSVVSNSWGDIGDSVRPSTLLAYEAAFLQGAMEGISYVFSSGDNGDEVTNVGTPQTDYPASDPYVTAVGGTSTEIKRTGIVAETGWQTSKYGLSKDGKSWSLVTDFLYGGGGGYSTNIPEPSYQTAAGIVSPNGGRAVPDVSMDADPTTGMLVGQTQAFPGAVGYDTYRIGGTSLAAPLFSGMTAVKVSHHGGLGLLNPMIYTDHSGFQDVTGAGVDAGNIRADFANGLDASGGYVYTVRTFNGATTTLKVGPGWDTETGWGSARAGWMQ